jgi:hypothetical protein
VKVFGYDNGIEACLLSEDRMAYKILWLKLLMSGEIRESGDGGASWVVVPD